MPRVRGLRPTLAIPDSLEEIFSTEDVDVQLSKMRNNFNILESKYAYLVSDTGHFTSEYYTDVLSRRLPITFEDAVNNQAVFTDGGGELISRKTTGQGAVVLNHNPFGHGIWTIPHIRNLDNDLILQENGLQDIDCFGASPNNTTPAFTISGYRNLDALRTLSISVGVGAADRVDFTGLSTYYFGGAITATGGVVPGGNITMGDDEWIGLGAAAGRLVFDLTPAPDLLSFMDCDVAVTGDLTVAGNIDAGTNELTIGSINRASGTMTLEIGGTAEISITNTEVTAASNFVIGSAEAATDYTLTFNGETNDFVATWMEDEAILSLSEGIFLPDNKQIQWGGTLGTVDAAMYSDGTDWIMWTKDGADIELNAATEGSGEIRLQVADNDKIVLTNSLITVSEEVLMNSTEKMTFGDTGTYINQSADGVLDVVSDTTLNLKIGATAELALNATTATFGTTVICGGATPALTLANGSITDGSGALSFGDENLSTTGTLAAGATTLSGILKVPDGAVGAPSIAFTSDPDVGIYRSTTNHMGFSAAGALKFSVINTNLKSYVRHDHDNAIDMLGAGSALGGIYFRGTHGGNSEGIFCEDSAGSARNMLTFPGSDETRLANRGPNGFVQIEANTATAGGGGAVIVAKYEDTLITHNVTLQIDSNVINDSGASAALTFDGSQNITTGGNVDLNGNDLTCDELTLTKPTNNHKFTAFTTLPIFENQVSGTGASLAIATKDGDGTDNASLQVLGVGNSTSFVNRERLLMFWSAANSQYEIFTEADGTGTLRPLVLYTEGNTDQLKLTTAGNVELSGDLTVTGNNISDSGGVALTFNGSGGLTCAAGVDVTNDMRARQCIADGDNAGIIGTTSLTNVLDIGDSTAPTHINLPTGVTGSQAGWIKMYVGTTVAWVPYWTA